MPSSTLIRIESPDTEQRNTGIDAVFVRSLNGTEYKVLVGKTSKHYYRQNRLSKNDPSILLDENMPDAELWLKGVHINGKLHRFKTGDGHEEIMATRKGIQTARDVREISEDEQIIARGRRK